MINIKKLSIIALALLLIGVVGSLFTFSQVTNKEANREEKSISDEVTDVEVISDNAAVEVIPTTGTDTRIELVSKGVDVSKLNFSADVEGKKLTVKLKDRRSFHIGFQSQSLHLKVYVPKKSYKSFVVKSDNGKVDLNNVEGNLIGSSNNGKISLVTKDLDRNIQLESHNGKIMIKTDKEPTNTTFDVHAHNGKIDILNKYEGNVVIGKGENLVKLETNNGKIEITK